tara:strand:+ start:283 stop:621 length:339 start_codon:yes stop_codon:yes gene_type:complete
MRFASPFIKVYASERHPYNKVIRPSSLSQEVVASSPITDKTPVAPLLEPVKVSPTVKDPLGIFTVIVVEEGTTVTSEDWPLLEPEIVSEVVKVPDTLVMVNVNVLTVKLAGL